jgi:hypothetical protein
MKKNSFKKYLFITSVFLAIPLFVLADEYGLDATAGAAGLTKYGGNVAVLIGNVIGTALSMVGVIFFILMIYGGILWMTARGKEEMANKAKDTIIAAVIGLIVVLASYALTNFIFGALSGSGGGAPGGGAPNDFPPGEIGEACIDDEDCVGLLICVNQSCREQSDARPNTGYCIYRDNTTPKCDINNASTCLVGECINAGTAGYRCLAITTKNCNGNDDCPGGGCYNP